MLTDFAALAAMMFLLFLPLVLAVFRVRSIARSVDEPRVNITEQ